MRLRFLPPLLAASLLAAACSGEATDTADAPTTTTALVETTAAPDTTSAPTTAAPETTTEAPTTTAAAPPDLALLGAGPYDVGVVTIEIPNAENDRPLTVDVWMPLAEGTTGDAQEYTLIAGSYYPSPVAISATPDALSPDGPFPLVLYSHGSGGLRYIHSSYTETIASHGYLVVAPDHTGNTAVDAIANAGTEGNLTAWNRVNDGIAVLDAMLDPTNEATAPFAAAIDPDRIAVTGHSFGGFTAHAMVSGFSNDFGSTEPDERVDAIISLAPFTRPILSDEQLAGIDVPTLLIGASDDVTTPMDPNVDDPFALASADVAARVELLGAEHESFTDVCNMLEVLPQVETVAPFVVDALMARTEAGCDGDDLAIERVEALTQTFAVSFLDAVLKEGALVDPAAVTLPDDVRYEARGF